MSKKKKENKFFGGNKPLKYEYEFDLEGDSAAAKILRWVKDGSKVLEIGAGSGSIAIELKRNNNCHVTALDINPQFVERLGTICDAAYQIDLNDECWPEVLEDEKFDVVIAADILEHLWDPWTTLSQIRALIKEDGDIIISLPHAGHCVVSACLINGDFDYQDGGLLDRTHIRFFALKNIQSLINNAGLGIVDAHFVVKRPESTDLAIQWNRLSAELRQVLLDNRHSCVYQVVVKTKAKHKEHINLILQDIIVDKAPREFFDRWIPNAVLRTFIKKQIKSHISISSRRIIRRVIERFGIRI